MFQFDGQPIETHAGHEARGHNVRERQPGADTGLAAFEFGPDVVGLHERLSKVGKVARGCKL